MAKVLVIGGGGREHALGWKLAQSPHVSDVIYFPGNAGTSQEEKSSNVSISGYDNGFKIDKNNFWVIKDVIKSEGIDLTVVGPEQPLAEGLVDHLNSEGISRVFGPTMAGSQLEADKFFSDGLMEKLEISHANSIRCYSVRQARGALEVVSSKKGVVLKSRGLAGGKGVDVFGSKKAALNELERNPSKYGSDILVSERLSGEEFSVFGLSDGERVLPIEMSFQDHKRALDCDRGRDTGGMGAYGPAPVANAGVVRYVAENIMTSVVQKMRTMKMNGKSMEYNGFLYAGMMKTEEGLKVIEFNCRMGDPECQPAMMMLKSDLYEALSLTQEDKLDQVKLEYNQGSACCIVMASKGYPGNYKTGFPIIGISEADAISSMGGDSWVKVFHSGTKRRDTSTLTNGGRVLGVTGYSSDGLELARRLAYEGVGEIHCLDKSDAFHVRNDIGNRGLGKSL